MPQRGDTAVQFGYTDDRGCHRGGIQQSSSGTETTGGVPQRGDTAVQFGYRDDRGVRPDGTAELRVHWGEVWGSYGRGGVVRVSPGRFLLNICSEQNDGVRRG